MPGATTVAVPFLDLAPVHAPLRQAIVDDVAALIDSGAFTNGPPVAEFETAFAEYVGVRRCVGVGSGLDALRLGLLAAGLEPGDEVIVPANTFVASFEAITQAGGVPVPVDVSLADWNIDVDAAEAAVGRRTRAVMPVHLYGQQADIVRIAALARRHDLIVLEDACQAHGAVRDGLRAGAVGTAAAFSFYPGKNLGAAGDAGALTTSDETLAERVVALREHGQRAKYVHELRGYTARLDTIQALFLQHKLPLLDGWNDERRAAAAFYAEAFAGVEGVRTLPVPAGSLPVWHLYPVLVDDPAAVAARLLDSGVATGRHYPQPPHLSAAYADLGHRAGSFPVTERLARHLLSLPIYPGLGESQREAVAAALLEAVGDGVRPGE